MVLISTQASGVSRDSAVALFQGALGQHTGDRGGLGEGGDTPGLPGAWGRVTSTGLSGTQEFPRTQDF